MFCLASATQWRNKSPRGLVSHQHRGSKSHSSDVEPRVLSIATLTAHLGTLCVINQISEELFHFRFGKSKEKKINVRVGKMRLDQ